jgi:hypothetical protein
VYIVYIHMIYRLNEWSLGRVYVCIDFTRYNDYTTHAVIVCRCQLHVRILFRVSNIIISSENYHPQDISYAYGCTTDDDDFIYHMCVRVCECNIKLYNNNNIIYTHTGKADFYRGKSVLDRDDTDNGRRVERERKINARTRSESNEYALTLP